MVMSTSTWSLDVYLVITTAASKNQHRELGMVFLPARFRSSDACNGAPQAGEGYKATLCKLSLKDRQYAWQDL